jgi:hypothetical protein
MTVSRDADMDLCWSCRVKGGVEGAEGAEGAEDGELRAMTL